VTIHFLTDHPLILFAVTSCVLGISTWIGTDWQRRRKHMTAGSRDDYALIVTSTLTLLGLIIGFSFSMAISRYDLRKGYEEAEANAIGTEYVRADLLPRADAIRVRTLLDDYLQQRVLFYSSHDEHLLQQVNDRTSRLQSELWAAVVPASSSQPTPVLALAVSGMNDVLNSQGYSQAAWWNRMPAGAWILMMAIAVIGTLMIGFGVRDAKADQKLLLVLPCVLAITFMLIADIDSPRGGLIRVAPQNLQSLQASIRPH